MVGMFQVVHSRFSKKRKGMRTEQHTRIGIFHRDESNRKALMHLLKDKYDCAEIEKWENVEDSRFDVLVLSAPELLYPSVSFEEISKVIHSYKSNVIMINNDNSKWWIYRLNFIQLRNPSLEVLLKNIQKLCPEKKVKHSFLRIGIRA